MNLKQLRLKNNLRQEDIAKIINKSSVAYGYYENGTREPDIKTLITLADFFDVSLDFLCERTKNNDIGYIPEKKKNLISSILKLSDNDFEKLTYYINGFLDGHSKKQEINFYNPGEENE